jgi:hypothetical protein
MNHEQKDAYMYAAMFLFLKFYHSSFSFFFFGLHGGLKRLRQRNKNKRISQDECEEPFGHKQQHQGHSNKFGKHSKEPRRAVLGHAILGSYIYFM